MNVTTQTDPQGRKTVVQLHDDRGKPFKFVSNAFPLVDQFDFTEVLTIPLFADASVTPERPDLLKGQIFIAVQGAWNISVVFFDFVLAEILVVGYVGGVGTVIARGMIGGGVVGGPQDGALMRVTFENDDTYDKIGILARQNDSQNANAPGQVQDLSISAVAYMWG